MKIALVDNMNNNFFSFARYLRDENIDVHLYKIPNRSMDHFKPESDTFEDTDSMQWIHSFPTDINNNSWFFFDKVKIKKEFEAYDLLVSCGLSSAYLERSGIVSDITIPYGSDLYDIPFRKIDWKLSLYFIRSLFWKNQAKYQIRAFSSSRVIVTDNDYILYRKALDRLDLQACNFGIPMIYNKENLDFEENRNIWNFLNDYDFIVFNHSRQHWASYHPALDDFEQFGGLKRNDKLVRAFSHFIQVSKFKNPVLVLFEYGTDFSATKRLVKELKIEHFVKWMPTMNRKNIMYGLGKATFSSNAFRENKADIGGVCYESLAAGTPHINNCIEAVENPNHKFYNAPMIHALSETDIVNIFRDYEKDPHKYKEIGKKSKKWFNEHLGIGLAKKYIELVKLLARDKKITQNDKIVREIFEN